MCASDKNLIHRYFTDTRFIHSAFGKSVCPSQCLWHFDGHKLSNASWINLVSAQHLWISDSHQIVRVVYPGCRGRMWSKSDFSPWNFQQPHVMVLRKGLKGLPQKTPRGDSLSIFWAQNIGPQWGVNHTQWLEQPIPNQLFAEETKPWFYLLSLWAEFENLEPDEQIVSGVNRAVTTAKYKTQTLRTLTWTGNSTNKETKLLYCFSQWFALFFAVVWHTWKNLSRWMSKAHTHTSRAIQVYGYDKKLCLLIIFVRTKSILKMWTQISWLWEVSRQKTDTKSQWTSATNWTD